MFLLSPANSSGERAQLVFNPRAGFALARDLRERGAALGDVFSFMSGLYFRGKLLYARAFSCLPPGLPGVLVITPSEGLRPPELVVDLPRLASFSTVPIDIADDRYRRPLVQDAERLAREADDDCEFVLLGSVATGKYVEPFTAAFGERLVFPAEFVGRGDMSRGGLLLRCVDSREELAYVPVAGAVRHGRRPPRLTPRPRARVVPEAK